MVIRKSVSLFFALFFLFFYNSCRNNTTISHTNNDRLNSTSQADSLTERASKQKAEAIDTPDCAMLVLMTAHGPYQWIFAGKQAVIIKNDGKPDVKIILQKITPDTGAMDNLIMSFAIDSELCIDRAAHITFTFDDNSTAVFENFTPNNCNGEFGFGLDPLFDERSNFKLNPKLKKIRLNKIINIRIVTHNGNRDYVLNEINATNLMYIINCIHKAK